MDLKIKQAVPKVGLETSSIERAEGGVRRRATAIFGPKIREPQETIQIRNPRTATIEEHTHPYKMYAAVASGSCRLHVWRGACTANSWSWDDTTVWGVTLEIVPVIGLGLLISDAVPIGNAGAGYLTLTASSTYGIWLMVGADNTFSSGSSSFDPIQGLFPNSVSVHFQRFDFGAARVASSSTYTDPEDAPDMGLNEAVVDTKDLAIYLGKVVVDADGVGTITQYRESDVCLHSPLLTAPVIVSDTGIGGSADNTLSPGDDGGAYLAP